MRRIILTLILSAFIASPAIAFDFGNTPEHQVKRLLESQVRYANKTNFKKFISTYDEKYVNADGLNIEDYSSLVKDTWDSYNNIKYGIKIKSISVNENKATAELFETAHADISISEAYGGELKSESDSIYYLEKINGKWKVVSDSALSETTSMLYGQAKNLDIKLSVPNEINANTEYTASLEFTPPEDTVAVASITADKVEYPQKSPKEVFRNLPEDNILERLFTANNSGADEYVIASIGLTKTQVCDLSIQLSLIGFGYKIKRVNVISENNEVCENEQNK